MQEGAYQERRLVTVLFADFVGFTTLAEELDPEVLQETVFNEVQIDPPVPAGAFRQF